MRKKPNLEPKKCIQCGKEYKPNSTIQQYCSDCAKIRDKERKQKWHKEHYQYSTRPKRCLESCCICGGKFLAHIDGKPYCSRHYNRLHKNGSLTSKIGCSFGIDGDILRIVTKKGQMIIADASDYEKLSKHSWCISKTGYPVANINKKTTKLYRYLLDITDPNVIVDHKNHNPLDNRRINLRICTVHENALNQSGKKGRKLPVGISKTKSGKYSAEITVNRKQLNLGVYESLEEAVKVRHNAEIRYRGDFAPHLYEHLKENGMIQTFTYDTDAVRYDYTVLGVVYMPNGCCKDQPVLITKNYMRGGDNYSCQCACGIWCTTGHPTVAGAIRDYQTMSNGGIPMVDNY